MRFLTLISVSLLIATTGCAQLAPQPTDISTNWVNQQVAQWSAVSSSNTQNPIAQNKLIFPLNGSDQNWQHKSELIVWFSQHQGRAIQATVLLAQSEQATQNLLLASRVLKDLRDLAAQNNSTLDSQLTPDDAQNAVHLSVLR